MTARRALILEDDPVIALDVEAELRDAGWNVAGVAGTVGAAYDVLDRQAPHAALLDINLGPETSFDIARACRRAGTKVIFMSGYASSVLPDDLRAETILRKPIQMSRMLDLLDRIGRG